MKASWTLALLSLIAPLCTAQDAQVTAALEEALAPFNAEGAPGAIVAVLRDAQPVAVYSFGLAQLDSPREIGRSTPFYLASLAKPFTAAAVVLAADEGALDLDSSVRELFPELPASYEPATLRHLIHHASGIPDVYDAAIIADLGQKAVADNAAAIQLLTHLPRLCFPPGQRMLYSNSGYLLMAEALQRGTGESLQHWAAEKIFRPAGMDQAYFIGDVGDRGATQSSRATRANRATSYERDDRGGWREKSLLTGLVGPGGMVASMDDLIAFEQAWQSGRIGDAKLLSDLLTPRYSAHPRLGAYGAGWMHQKIQGLAVERHYGGAFGYSSDFMRFPDQAVTLISLSNREGLSAKDINEAVAGLVLEDAISAAKQPAASAVELSSAQQQRLGRMWREQETGLLWVLSPRREGFVLASLGDAKLKLTPTSPSRLEALDAPSPWAVELRQDALVIVETDGRERVLEAVPFPPRDLPDRSECIGTYSNSDLNAEITFGSGPQGSIVLFQDRPLISIAPFQPITRDLYVCDTGAQIDVLRDEHDQVSGLKISGNRAWGVIFERVR